MRNLIIAIAVVALIGGFLAHRQEQPQIPAEQSVAIAKPAPAPTRQPHWPKSALDRAADAKRQVNAQRESNETP